MGIKMSGYENNDSLVDELKQSGYIKSKNIESVFRAVDRGFYFLPGYKNQAYFDIAWRSGNYHLSAPCIYATVMEKLNLKPRLSFLNIGSGTGYLSTMIGLILGPYGTNHGVEIHEELYMYAYEKLREFKRTSPAIDAFEFCEPIFVKGNCFCLQDNNRLYDRVYCGAACPESHESYMQNLLNVGGILVMPRDDRLVKITRTSDNKWDKVHIIPVSYATLQDPQRRNGMMVSLPKVEPLSLLEISRSVLRVFLREEALSENPRLTLVKKRSLKRKRVSNNDDKTINFENQDPLMIGLVISRRDPSINLTTFNTGFTPNNEEQFADDDQHTRIKSGEERPRKTRRLHDPNDMCTKNNSPHPSNSGVNMQDKIGKSSTSAPLKCTEILNDVPNTFSEALQRKISALPIPVILKEYLNYHRPF